MPKPRKRTWTTRKGETRQAWIIDYIAPDPTTGERERHIKTFGTRREATDWWEGQASYEVHQGTHTPASKSITIAKAAERWIADGRKEGRERSTIAQRDQHVRLHINPHLGSVKLGELTARGVWSWLDQLRDQGQSLPMRRKVLTSLKMLLTFAQARGLVAQNVALPIKIKADRRREARDIRAEMPTKAELRTMMDKAPPQWRAFIVTAIFTGLRASELRGLRWQDVDLEEGGIHVRQRIDAWGQIDAPKSEAGTRDIPLGPMAINALRQWELRYPRPVIGQGEDGEPVREEHRGEHLVFPNGQGRPESYANVRRRFFDKLQIENGVTVQAEEMDEEGKPVVKAKYGLHALRHAAASLFIEQGWTPKKVQTVMGHTSVQVTFDIYGGLFEDNASDRKAMERVEAALLAG